VSNEEFLRSYGIQVEISTDCRPKRDRVLELVNRTNQLKALIGRVPLPSGLGEVRSPASAVLTLRPGPGPSRP
jgi:hypothetical protein